VTQFRFWLWAALAATIALFPATSGAADGAVKRVAICPLTVHSRGDLSYLRDGLVDVFTSRLQVEGAIVPVDKGTVRAALGDLDPSNAPEKTLRAFMATVGADDMVYGSLTQLGESVSLDVRLLGAGEGAARSFATPAENLDALLPQIDRVLGEVRAAILPGAARQAPLPSPSAGPVAGAVQGRAKPVPEAVVGSAPLEATLTLDVPLDARGLGVGDVDGDGRNEVVVADSTNVFVYRLEGGELQQLAQYTGKSYEDFIHLDLADLDGNGAAEIFVTSSRSGPRSLVLGWAAGELRVLATDLPYFLRAFDGPEGRTRLVGQELSGGEWPFGGDRFEIQWREGSYVAGEKLPGALPVYGYLPVDLEGKGAEDTIVLDGEGRLAVFLGGSTPRWRSADSYEGGCVAYPVVLRRAGDDPPRYLELPPRMIAVPAASGSPARLLIARNTSNGILNLVRGAQHYDRGDLTDLTWTGKRLEKVWKYDEIRGCIADLQYRDVDNDGQPDLVVVAASGAGANPFSQGASSIYVFQGAIP
jgi:hypothetical protein